MRKVYKSLLTVSLIATAALSLSGCTNPNSNPEPTPSATTNAAGETNYQPRGATKSLTPVSENFLQDCPDVDAISLVESPLPPSEIQALNVCSGGNMVSFDPTSEWIEAYSALNADPEVSGDIACIGMLADPLIVWAVYEDEIIPFYAPQDVCGFPQPAAKTAYDQLAAVVSFPSEAPPIVAEPAV